MITKNLWLVLLAFQATFSFASDPEAIQYEQTYNQYASLLKEGYLIGSLSLLFEKPLSDREKRIALDAIENAIYEESEVLNSAKMLAEIEQLALPLREQVRVYRLLAEIDPSLKGSARELSLVSSLLLEKKALKSNTEYLYELFRSREYFVTSQAAALYEAAYRVTGRAAAIYHEVTKARFVAPSKDEIYSLVYRTQETNVTIDPDYMGRPRIFMFCRHVRPYPCLMIMKDRDDKLVRANDRGELWTHPALASSRRGKRFDQTNGNTPQGVWRVDGVMPTADQKMSFGKNRRLILNFVRKSEQESNYTDLLPKLSHERPWWKESVIARDVGRHSFRVHGTGHRNDDPSSVFYPFKQTAGCIAQRENTYDGVLYNDQRLLLDKLMDAQGLEPKYENEENIRALIYLIDIDSEEAPVTTQDLAQYGIR